VAASGSPSCRRAWTISGTCSNVLEPGDRVAGDTTQRIQQQRRPDAGYGRRAREHIMGRHRRRDRRVSQVRQPVAGRRGDRRLLARGSTRLSPHAQRRGARRALDREAVQTGSEGPTRGGRGSDRNPDVAIATVEEGQAHVHSVAQYGTGRASDDHQDDRQGASTPAAARSCSKSSRRCLKRLEVDAIILAGPGFTKQDAYKYLEENEPEVAELITMVDTAAVGDRGRPRGAQTRGRRGRSGGDPYRERGGVHR